MIDSLDLVIRQTIVSAIPALKDRIGFQPPDEAWRQRVSAGTGIWLNCALVDLREDRGRRSNEIRIERDPLRRVSAPFLMRCHYLLSAWHSGKNSAALAASVQEHGLLGHVVAALSEQLPLTPARVLLPAELAGIPAPWVERSFDTDLLPPEGFAKIPEFWGTMGRSIPWRPVIWLAVTVPVFPEPTEVDGIVLTILTSTGERGGIVGGALVDGEDLLTAGGSVTDASGPLSEALISLADLAGRVIARTSSESDGRFVLDGVPPGDYILTARTAAHPAAASTAVSLPVAAGGELTLTFP